jgi:hypothetical protein
VAKDRQSTLNKYHNRLIDAAGRLRQWLALQRFRGIDLGKGCRTKKSQSVGRGDDKCPVIRGKADGQYIRVLEARDLPS